MAAEDSATRAIHYSNYERLPSDHYATPDWVTEALLRHIALRDRVWEPCCGAGAMADVLIRNGHSVVATDRDDFDYGTSGVDFFQCDSFPEGCQALVTNPPYGDTGAHKGQARSPTAMLALVRHALTLGERAGGQVALLVRFQWIAGKRAASLLSNAPCVATIALTQRIRWFEMGEHTNTAQHHHAWIVFDYGRPPSGPPALLFAE